MTQVLGAAVLPMQAAGTRLRIGPVLDALGQRGVSSSLATFLSDYDLQEWLAAGRSRIGPGLRGAARIPRLLRAVSGCELMLLHREMLPVNSVFIERFALLSGTPFIWDVDDSLWAPTGSPKSLARGGVGKSRWMARHAAEVWAGNRQVALWAEAAGAQNVVLVPTTVTVPTSIVHSEREDDLLVWIGTPSTGPFIESLLHQLRDCLAGWRVLVIGANINTPPGIDVAQQPWSLAAESAALRRAAVGLYPLDVNHPAVSGKSALKAVLFMANGVALIATRTPSNSDVMSHGAEGFLVRTTQDWREALSRLKDPDLRLTMGAAGHQRATANYDSAAWGDRLASRVFELIKVGDT